MRERSQSPERSSQDRSGAGSHDGAAKGGSGEGPEKLLAECDVEVFRASGPGGQHRNRRESGVRLRHRPTGIVVTATERRSQHQNKRVALERLARRLAERRRRRRPRVPTRPARSAIERRVEEKKRRGRIKAGRGSPGGAEE